MNVQESTRSSCLSAYRMDRYMLGLENEQERRESQRHIEGCVLCRNERAHFLQLQREAPYVPLPTQEPASDSKAKPKHEASPRGLGWPWPWWGLAAGVAALAAIAVLPWWPWSGQRQKLRGQDWLVRGIHSPRLHVALLRKGRVRPARSGELFFAGDRLRLVVQWTQEGRVMVLHRDRRGRVTLLYPAETSRPGVPLRAGEKTILPGSLEVEGRADGPEELWACFSHRPLALAEVRRSLPPWSSEVAVRRWQPGSRGPCLSLHRFVIQRRPAGRGP